MSRPQKCCAISPNWIEQNRTKPKRKNPQIIPPHIKPHCSLFLLQLVFWFSLLLIENSLNFWSKMHADWVHTAHTAKPILVSYMAMHTRKKYTVDTCSLLWVYELLAFWLRILVKLEICKSKTKLENINLLAMAKLQ